MMIDHNVSDHWSPGAPDWQKSLVSSLDRHHNRSAVLPLIVIVEEIAEWIELASGVDAWKQARNRASLQFDLNESLVAAGLKLASHIADEAAAFQAALRRLSDSGRATLVRPPGMRTEAVWVDALTTARDLTEALRSDEAVRASWDDLVATAKDRSWAEREYRPIAELLFEQLRHRGLNADGVFRNLSSLVAFGRFWGESSIEEGSASLEERLEEARIFVGTPTVVEPVAVWLGYKGRVPTHLEAGRLSFYDAQWAVPNARPDGFDFAHKSELWEVVKDGYTFKVAELVDDESDVDTLVRVDLGTTTALDAVERAQELVDVVLSVSIYWAGGIRPQLAEYVVIRSGKPAGRGRKAVWRETGFPDDTYGAGLTVEALEQHGPRIADALAREQLPRFLAAAIQVQTTADRPFSRDMALRRPSDVDISNVIPLTDRVVQHVAAHAAMSPGDLFSLLEKRWPHARWLTDVHRAARMCLLGGGDRNDLLNELTGELMSQRPKQPWILLLADRIDDFLSLCRLEHERTWIARMFASISDRAVYEALIEKYSEEGTVLEARRSRARNALVHGNPVSFFVVQSVREFAEFMSGSALGIALESFVEGTDPAAALTTGTEEFTAMQGGQDAASFWRARTTPTN